MYASSDSETPHCHVCIVGFRNTTTSLLHHDIPFEFLQVVRLYLQGVNVIGVLEITTITGYKYVRRNSSTSRAIESQNGTITFRKDTAP